MGTIIELDERRVRPAHEIAKDLEAFSGMPLMLEAQLALLKFARLLNPVYMGLCQDAMTMEEPHKDETPVFSFMGSGASDSTTMGLFRELMGDERLALKAFEQGVGIAPGDQ